MYKLLYFIPIIHLTACATATKSTIIGAVVGSLITTGATLMAKPESSGTQAAIIATGAAVGALAGYEDFSSKSRRTDQWFQGSNSDDLPQPSRPIVKRMFVPDRVEGNKLIKGHDVFIIDQPAAWGATHE